MLAWLKRMLTPSGEETVARSFTRKNALCLLSFALVFCLLFAGAEQLFYTDYVYELPWKWVVPRIFSTPWNRIREEKTVPQVLIMGNSHAFCTFVPDILNGALQTDAAILGASVQNVAAVADNLEAVLHVGTPKLVIVELEAVYRDFDSMRTSYRSAALGNINGMPGLITRMNAAWHQLGFDYIPQGMFELLRADLMWSRWSALGNKQTNRYLYRGDVLGYVYMDSYATGNFNAADNQAAYYAMLETAQPKALDARSETELRRIIRLAATYDVPLLLVKAPTPKNQPDYAAYLRYIEQIVREEDHTVLAVHDFHADEDDIGLTLNDIYDNGHLNRQGAAKFTEYFAQWLGEKLGMPTSPITTFAYASETIEPLDGGQTRFTMRAWGQDVQYRFTMDGEVLKEWSSENSIVLTLDPSEADKLSVSMCPKALLPQADWYTLTLPFMVANSCVLE